MNILKTQTAQPIKFLSIILISFSMILSSCGKSDDNVPAPATLIIVNASPTVATYLVYLDGTKVMDAALPFGGQIPYKQLTAADHTVKFTSESSSTALLTKSITLEAGKPYSYFLIDKNSTMDGLLVSDVPDSYSADKAYIRFTNLSPDAPALNLAQSSSETDLITDKSYKEVSGFVAMAPGTYTFNAKDKLQQAIKATLSSTVLQAGYYYTIMCIGLENSGDNESPLRLQIYAHK